MCECQTYFEIRSCCDPIYNKDLFQDCCAKYNTAYFHISNDYEVYKRLEKCKNRIEKHNIYKEVASAYPYNIEASKLYKIIKLVEQDEEQYGDYNCSECGYYVTYDNEGEDPNMFMCHNCYTDKQYDLQVEKMKSVFKELERIVIA